VALLGAPWDVDLRLPRPATSAWTLFYSQAVVDRLGVSEDQIRGARWTQAQGWELWQPSGGDNRANWRSFVMGPNDPHRIVVLVAVERGGRATPTEPRVVETPTRPADTGTPTRPTATGTPTRMPADEWRPRLKASPSIS
jgi:hypothetical protein